MGNGNCPETFYNLKYRSRDAAEINLMGLIKVLTKSCEIIRDRFMGKGLL